MKSASRRTRSRTGTTPAATAASDSQVAAKTIRAWIEQGELERDERLPSVRALADTLGTTRYAICEAIHQLEDRGWIRKVGHKYVVSRREDTRPDRTAPPMPGTVIVLADAGELNSGNILIPGFDRVIEVSAMIAAKQAGLNVLSVNPERITRIQEELDRLLAQKSSGVIAFHDTLIQETDIAVLKMFQNAGMPVVVYGNDLEYAPFDTVESDHDAGGYQLTKLLIDHGRRRILPFMPLQIVTDRIPRWLEQRLSGYHRAMMESGLEPMEAIHCPGMPCEFGLTEETYSAVVRMAAGFLMEHIQCDEPIDAVMAISDKFCFPLATACRRLFGLRPHDDITITGYDNYWADSHIYNHLKRESIVPYATVDKNNFEIGRRMTELLLGRINGKVSGEAKHELIEPRLIVV